MIYLMVAHVCEIGVWAFYYDLAGTTPESLSAFDFAFENYTALGYGNVVPPEGKRLTGPITALNGLLLIGWSVAVIFEVMRMAEVKIERLDDKDES
jgi:Ion channel